MNLAVFRFSSVLVLVVGIGCSQPAEKLTSTSIPSEKQNVAAQASANPSNEAFELQAPISIVKAGEFWDGGTVCFHLRDSLGKEAKLCVYQAAFENVIPANSIFIGAVHPNDVSARLPRSAAEVERVVAALKSAAEPLATDELRELSQYDPLELHTRELASKAPDGTAVVILGEQPKPKAPEREQHTEEQWHAIYALHAIRRLESVEKHTIMTDDPSTVPSWFADYDESRKKTAAENEQYRQKLERFYSHFPEHARRHFKIKYGLLDDSTKLERKHGKELAAAVGDPVELVVMSSRALGESAWVGGIPTSVLVMFSAVESVDGKSIEAALKRIEGDDIALNGAAELFFEHGLADKLSPEAREIWAPRFADMVFSDESAGNRSNIIEHFARDPSVASRAYLKKIANGTFGTASDRMYANDDECYPSDRAHACLRLAILGDQSIKEQITTAAENARDCDRLTYELALAAFEPSLLKREFFRGEPDLIPIAALEIVRACGGKHGLQFVIEDALDHEWAAVKNEAVMVVQDVTGKTWAPANERAQPRYHADEIRAWWKSDEAAAFRSKIKP